MRFFSVAFAVLTSNQNTMPHFYLHLLRLGIRFLRSPAIAHPDHFDMRALLTYAVANNRQDELIESGCAEIRKVGVLFE